MKPSQKCVDLVSTFEGCSLVAYLCPSGVPTIFYGCTVYKNGAKVRLGDRGNIQQAKEQLAFDLDKFAHAVGELVKVPVTQNQFDALVSFAFNVGYSALAGSTLLKFLNSGNYTTAANWFAPWNKGMVKGQLTVLPGLVRRRQAEKDLFLSDDTPESAPVSNAICMTCRRPL